MDPDGLYRQHSLMLFRYLTRLTGDAELAADGVQEAFVRLIERPPADGAARAWLFRVGTNFVLERSRQGSRRLRLLQARGSSVLPEPASDPVSDVERLERQRQVRAALDALRSRDRVALLMQAEGFSHREIAAVINANVKAVGSILERALRKLAGELRLDQEES